MYYIKYNLEDILIFFKSTFKDFRKSAPVLAASQ